MILKSLVLLQILTVYFCPSFSASVDPCNPSPCGSNSQCRTIKSGPVCSCLDGYIGRPPTCRPECGINADCADNLVCLKEKCTEPCPGLCGSNAECTVVNHLPICNCKDGHTGNPFTVCHAISQTEETSDPCNPSPCGVNAECKQENGIGSCVCLPDRYGNPYTGCKSECQVHTDCYDNKACVNQKCQDPCPGTCGIKGVCDVMNHVPTCNCPPQHTGDPFLECVSIESETKV